MTSDEALAHVEIRQVLATYSRGVDRWDVELLKSVYHPDARDNHSMFVGSGWEFADYIVRLCAELNGVSQHHLTNSYIEVHGATANVETYYIVYHFFNGEDGRPQMLNAGGRYIDRFERREGAWKISDRFVTMDWSRNGLAGEPWADEKKFPLIGGKDRDPSYDRFRADHTIAP